MSISFTVASSPAALLELDVDVVAIAGFTGRDRRAVAAHLEELAELGVPMPASTPCYYQAPPTALAQTDRVTTVQADTSGEAECVVIIHRGERFLTLGSDHTDRAAEAVDIPISKALCPKPVASRAWRLADVEDHIEQIELRSWVTASDGEEVLYQEGLLSAFMPFDEIIDGIPFHRQPSSYVLFTGTLPAIGGIRPADRFRAELRDPVTGHAIELAYRTAVADYVAL